MVADFGEHTYDENKVCTVCRTQYVSKGLEYTMSANGPHWVVSGISSCTDTVIYIPAAYNGIPVKEIGAHAFHENTTITGVVLPNSITTINAHAFFCCINLASINLPEGLTTIGEGRSTAYLSQVSSFLQEGKIVIMLKGGITIEERVE